MQKIIAIVLALILTFSIVGCNQSELEPYTERSESEFQIKEDDGSLEEKPWSGEKHTIEQDDEDNADKTQIRYIEDRDPDVLPAIELPTGLLTLPVRNEEWPVLIKDPEHLLSNEDIAEILELAEVHFKIICNLESRDNFNYIRSLYAFDITDEAIMSLFDNAEQYERELICCQPIVIRSYSTYEYESNNFEEEFEPLGFTNPTEIIYYRQNITNAEGLEELLFGISVVYNEKWMILSYRTIHDPDESMFNFTVRDSDGMIVLS